MIQIKPGTIIFSRRHNCLLRCIGRNGGRPEQHFGSVVRKGKTDPESCRIFTAEDVVAIKEGRRLQYLLPGTVADVYDLPGIEDWLHSVLDSEDPI